MKLKDFLKKYFPKFVVEGFETYYTDDNELFYSVRCANNIILNIGEEDLKQASSDNRYIY